MPRRKAQLVPPPAPPSPPAHLIRKRGRPKKVITVQDESSPIHIPLYSCDPNDHDHFHPHLIQFIRHALSLMKIFTYRQAIEELNRLWNYISASIDFGEMNGHRKPSIEQLIEIITELYK